MQLLPFLQLAVTIALVGVFIWSYIRFRDKAQKAETMQANLPEAVKLDDLKARVASEEKRLNDIQTQMRSQGTQLSDALEAIEAKRKAEEWLELNRPEIASIERERQEQREIRASLDDLKQQLATLTAEHRELSRDASGIDAKRNHAREQLAATIAELQEKSRKLEETQRVVESLQERRSQLRNEVAELDVLSERHKKLDHEVNELTQTRRALAAEVDSAQFKKASLEESVATLTADLHRKTDALEEAQTAFTSVNDQHQILKAQVAELAALASRHEGLAAKHEALNQQVDRLTRQKTELAREVSAAEAQRQQATTELAEINSNLQEQTQALEEVRTTCESLRDERSQLKAEVAQFEVLAKRQSELESSVNTLAAQRSELVNAIAQGQSQKQQIEVELERHHQELTEISQAIEAKRLTVESLAEQRATLRTEVAELSELSRYQRELKQEIAAFEQRKEELLQAANNADQLKQHLLAEIAPLEASLQLTREELAAARASYETLCEKQGTLKAEVAQLEGLSIRQRELIAQIDSLAQRQGELAATVAGHEQQKQQLEIALAPLRSDVADSTRMLSEIRASIETLRDRQSTLKSEVAELEAIKQQQHQLQAAVASLGERERELGEHVAQMQAQKHQLDSALPMLHRDLEQTTRALADTRIAVESLRERQSVLKGELADAEQLAQQQQIVQANVASLVERERELSDLVAGYQAQKHQLESTLPVLRRDLEQGTQSLAETRAAVQALLDRELHLKNEVAGLDNLVQQQQFVQASVASLIERERELSNLVAGYQAQKHQLESTLPALHRDLQQSAQSLTDTRAAVELLHDRQSVLKGEVADLEYLAKQQRSLQDQIVALTQEERDLHDRVSGYLAQKHELEAKLPIVQQDLAEAQSSLASMHDSIEAAREQYSVLKSNVSELQKLAQRADALRLEVGALSQQHREVAALVAAAETRKQQLDELLLPLNSELSEKTKLLHQTRAAFDALCERQGLLKAEVAQLDGLLARQQSLQLEIASLTQQQRDLAGIVSNQESRKQHLEQQLATLASDLSHTSNRLDETRHAFDSLCERQGTLKAEVAELEGLSQQQKGLRIEVEALAQEQHQLVSTLASQNTQKNQLENEIASLSQHHAATSAQLTEARNAYEALCEKQGSLKAEVAEYAALAQQQRTLHTQIEELTKQQRELAIHVSSRLDQKAQLEESLASAKTEFAEVSTRLSESRAAVQSLAERHGSLKAEVIELESLAHQQQALRKEVAQLTQQQHELATTVNSQDSQRSALEQQLATLKSEFEETSTRLGESRTAFDALCERQGTLKAQVLELEAMAQLDAKLRDQVAALTERQTEASAAVQQLQYEKQQLENQIAPLRHDLEDKTRILHDTRIAVEAMRERQGALKGEIAELESLAARQQKLQTQVEDLTKQQRDLAGSVSQHENRRKQLEEQIAPLTIDLAAKTQAMQETRAAVELLSQKQAALKAEVAELEVLSARQKSLQSEVGDLTSQHTTLALQVAAATHQKDSLDDQLAKISADLVERSTTLEEVKAAWHDLRDKKASLKTEVAELDALANRFRNLQTEVTALSGQQAELSKHVAVADSRKAQLDEELSTTTAELNEKTHALQETRAAVDALQERKAGLRAEVADLESLAKKHATLTQQVDQLAAAKRELDHALMTCDAQKGTAERELSALLTQLEERTQTLDETKATHQQLSEQVASLRTQVSELNVLAERHAKLESEVASMVARHAELDAQLTSTGQRKEHRDSELAEVTTYLAERRKAMDETSKAVEVLKIQRNALTAEVADLEVLAARHHDLEEQIAQLSEQAKELAHDVGSGQMRRTQLQEKLDAITKQIKEHEDTLKEGRTEIDLLREVRGGLKAEVSELTRLSETYQQLKNAVSELTQKNAKLHIEVASLDVKKTEATERATSLADELAQRTTTLHEVRSEYDALREQHASLKAQVSELSVLSKSRREESETLGQRLGELVQNLQQKSKVLDETKKRHDELSEQVSGLAARREQLEKTVEVVSDTLKELRLQTGYRGNNAGPLSELWKPALLKSEFAGPRTDDEQTCLKQTKKYLSNTGLRFPSRVIHAFHTSLKVSEVSPLVVLAGISGTGKSELARRYAEGMGMHFLNLPVQPRWDSPQDMFGFFNYIENQYRATELARALVQMDPFVNEESRGWQTPEGWSESLADRMLVVLLDEMNLARVEYYFSEFLSRLETRRGIRKTNANDRRKAEITLEVGMHGATDPTMRLFVDTTVLFVGTINEDETTQTLSEKVVDRSNVLAFGRPPRLTDMPRISANGGNNGTPGGHHSEKFVAYKQWQQWIKKESDLEPAAGAQVNRWIEEMNQAMEMIRRPFAFRTHAAIRAYAANYPEQGDKGLSFAMADQIEQKILPKFRGLDPNEENVGRSLDRIVGLLDELGDGAMINAVETSRRDGTREHQFIFRGVDRSADLAEVMV